MHMEAPQVAEALARIERRLESVERKLDSIEPKQGAMRIAAFARLLDYKPSQIRQAIRSGKIRTIRITEDGHPRVPLSELVRLTAIPETTSKPIGPLPKLRGSERAEIDAIRALSKRR
jgi:hypothetical protein